ncbi:MAG: hypothetical protein WDN46_10280 [Methylocella sp.]
MTKDDLAGASGMSPRKQMASGGDMPMSGNYGCDNLESMSKKNPEASTDLHRRTMADDDRGAGKPVKHSPTKFRSQSNADHGPHAGAHGVTFGTGPFPK